MSKHYAVYQYGNGDDRQIVAIYGVGNTKEVAWADAEANGCDLNDDTGLRLTDCTEALHNEVQMNGDNFGSSRPYWDQGVLDTEYSPAFIFMRKADKHGTVNWRGNTYALLEQVEVASFGQAYPNLAYDPDADRHLTYYLAPAMDHEGNPYKVCWAFEDCGEYEDGCDWDQEPEFLVPTKRTIEDIEDVND